MLLNKVCLLYFIFIFAINTRVCMVFAPLFLLNDNGSVDEKNNIFVSLFCFFGIVPYGAEQECRTQVVPCR